MGKRLSQARRPRADWKILFVEFTIIYQNARKPQYVLLGAFRDGFRLRFRFYLWMLRMHSGREAAQIWYFFLYDLTHSLYIPSREQNFSGQNGREEVWQANAKAH